VEGGIDYLRRHGRVAGQDWKVGKGKKERPRRLGKKKRVERLLARKDEKGILPQTPRKITLRHERGTSHGYRGGPSERKKGVWYHHTQQRKPYWNEG